MKIEIVNIKGGVIVKVFQNGAEIRITITGKATDVKAEVAMIKAQYAAA